MFFSKKKINNGPLISVIIPSYNHEKFINECVDSVLKQTYDNLELIIIDDGSKDGTAEILNKYSDDRMKVIFQENAGAHNAINRGLELAKGEYLTILNSDDVYMKNRLELIVNYLMENKDISLVSSYIQIIDANSKELGIKKAWKNMEPWKIEDKDKSFAGTDDPIKNLIMSNYISTTSNMVFTQKLYEDIGGMRNLRFAHDWDFALRAAEYGKCGVIEKPLMKYRIHSTNTISSNRKHMLFEICWMYAVNIHRFEGIKIFEGDFINGFEELAESMNFQGNDRLVWMLMSFLNSSKKRNINEPELLLLNDRSLRESLFKYIVE
ncbi:glycosyltransferase [Clostridium sp. ZS6]|uniref:glycosyltransferase n=1 Tax=Clostridium sp. ZS6 TaxID=2949987 RepID=UPI00207AA0BD|nr:glycosyltransferase [Clostridium sp. ZS6]